jgi:hypothetical protein
MYTSFPVKGISQSQLLAESKAGQTVPLWSGHIKAAGQVWHYTMVGKDPMVKQTDASSSIKTMIVPLSLTFQDTNETFNASAADPACGVTTSADQLVLDSPLFQNHDYHVGGKNVGSVQYEDMFQRSEWAKYVYGAHPKNHKYGIVFTKTGPSSAPQPIGVSTSQGVTALTSQNGLCTDIGVMDITQWDPFVQSSLIPFLQTSAGLTPKMNLVLLLYNVVMSEGVGLSAPCCILGYHSGVQTPSGTQYYSVADFDSSGAFTKTGAAIDIAPLSHELGEWLNDPSGTNATPPWGHIGQVQGCQTNLEVGDPLSGTTLSVPMPNGVTYHPQELAFFSWFYRQRPSVGIHHWYSSNGTFKTPSKPCH